MLNGVRGAPLSSIRKLLKQGGVLINLAARPLDMVTARLRNLVSSRRTVSFLVQTSGALLEGLAKMIESGQVRPVVETGRVTGKVAVAPR